MPTSIRMLESNSWISNTFREADSVMWEGPNGEREEWVRCLFKTKCADFAIDVENRLMKQRAALTDLKWYAFCLCLFDRCKRNWQKRKRLACL